MKKAPLQVLRFDLLPYEDALSVQEDLARKIGGGDHPPTLLLLQHPHTFTFGRRGQEANLVWSEQERELHGVEVHWTDRGGDVTYHGPGQLIGYPILPLGSVNAEGRLPRADYVGYLRRLEQVLIKALANFGIVSGQIPGLTGVWVQPDVASRCPNRPPAARVHPSKIASIGVKVDVRGISRHGFALNVDPDMSYWQGIIACGLPQHPAISMADLMDRPPIMEVVMDRIVESFAQVYGYQVLQDLALDHSFEH